MRSQQVFRQYLLSFLCRSINLAIIHHNARIVVVTHRLFSRISHLAVPLYRSHFALFLAISMFQSKTFCLHSVVQEILLGVAYFLRGAIVYCRFLSSSCHERLHLHSIIQHIVVFIVIIFVDHLNVLVG